MPRQNVLHQAVLVPSPVRAKGALELGIDTALEVVMPLQMVFVFVRLPAGCTGMFKCRTSGIVQVH